MVSVQYHITQLPQYLPDLKKNKGEKGDNEDVFAGTCTKATSFFGTLRYLIKKMMMMKMRMVMVVAMMMMTIPAPEGKRPAFWNWEFFELQ